MRAPGSPTQRGHAVGAPRAGAASTPPTARGAAACAAAAPPARAAGAAGTPAAPAPRPAVVRLGVLADVQAADIDDGAGFSGRPRYYRAAVDTARRAASAFAAASVDAVLHLGDIVDGFQPRATAPAVLDAVVGALGAARAPCHHVIGNHCLASLGRALANERLGMGDGAAATHSYGAAPLAPGWRLVALDGYDVSVAGRAPGDPRHAAAAALLAERNPNPNKNSADGLVGPDRRFVAFGGGVGDAQLAWLDGQLAAAAAAGERVVVAVHQPIHADTAPPVCLLWNYDAVNAVLAAHGPGVVAAVLAGHAHRDGAATCAASGIHHRVFAAVLETAPGGECWAVLELGDDEIVVRGHGVASARLPLAPRAVAAAKR